LIEEFGFRLTTAEDDIHWSLMLKDSKDTLLSTLLLNKLTAEWSILNVDGVEESLESSLQSIEERLLGKKKA
jgi:hypothetical protein